MNLSHHIRNVLTQYSVSFSESGRSFRLDCPKCGKNTVVIRKTNGRFICFYCSSNNGYSGSPDVVLADILGLTQEQAASLLDLDDFSSDVFDEEEVDSKIFYKEFVPSIVSFDHPRFKDGFAYLNSRGIDLNLIKYYDIRYDFVQKRVIFPMRDPHGLIGWTDRSILPESKLKYKNRFGEIKKIPKSLHNFQKSEFLLFNDKVPNKTDYLIIAEGPVSSIKAHKCGNNVATLGKIVSKKQIEIIKAHGIKKLYLGLDPDAYQETEKLVKKLYGRGFDLYLLNPTKGKNDLGDCSLEEVYEQFLSCTTKLTPSHIILA